MSSKKTGPITPLFVVTKANAPQKQQAFLQVHDAWPHHADPALHLKLRLASVQHLRADWFVGLHEGEVVTSLGGYPLKLSVAGERCKAIGIGAVYTQSAYRARGFAALLMRDVLHKAHAAGCRYALLYSDIGPAYYEKLGFQNIDCPEFFISLASLQDESIPSMDLDLVQGQVPAIQALPTLISLYDSQFTEHTTGIARDADHFTWLINRETDLECSLIKSAGSVLGYILFKWDKNQIVIKDYAFLPLRAIFRSWLLAIPAVTNATLLRGWYHNSSYNIEGIALGNRKSEITMIARLRSDDAVQINDKPVVTGHHLFSWLDHF